MTNAHQRLHVPGRAAVRFVKNAATSHTRPKTSQQTARTVVVMSSKALLFSIGFLLRNELTYA